jgi:hypothetical protein
MEISLFLCNTFGEQIVWENTHNVLREKKEMGHKTTGNAKLMNGKEIMEINAWENLLR